MIYERRTDGVTVKKEDMPIKDTGCMREKYERACAAPQRVELVSGTNFRLPSKLRRRRKFRNVLRAAAVVIFLVAVCVFVHDVKFSHGRLKRTAENVVRSGAEYALKSMEEKSGVVENTLYTRLVVENAEKKIPVPEQDVSSKQLSSSDIQSVIASGGVSSSFVDGTRFYPITSLDLSAQSVFAISNGTSFSPDTQSLADSKPAALENIQITDEPLVLILHTHGQECYTEHDGMYPETEETRSNDTQKNVVRVGKEIHDTLSDFGISAIHCTKMHDSESFINAYTSSAESVKKYLKEYPSVRIVVDVHRDAIIRDDGESIKTSANIAGKDYAQLMFVVGTNELGHNHPDWHKNLSLALTLQKSIESTYPSLCRSINLRNVPFNQQLSSGYLLLEVGTCANTLDQALRSARAFGENLARVLVSSRFDT